MSDRKRIKGERRWTRARRNIEIPVNVERVLLRASEDPGFRTRLLEERGQALEGEDLSASERGMLGAMSEQVLDAMIDRLAPERRKSSRFAKQVAAAVAGSVIISVSACGEDTSKGVGPDLDTGTEDILDTTSSDGDVTDVAGEDVTGEDVAGEDVVEDSPSDSMSWGARPDMPDE